ncbi:MAG: ArgE/DapE family deacylase [Candidatus Omnitrophota bacterium]
MINKNRLIRLTQKLIRIKSENPPGDESRIAAYIKEYFEKLGLEPRIYEFKKKRSNIVVSLKGKNAKHSLLITPHLDTVPAGRSWKSDPFGAKIKKNRIYGLGATDCKGNLACALEAISSLLEDSMALDYDLIFAATADEETGSSLGLVPLLGNGILNPDAAVILDSDNCDIIITQKGLIHLKVKLQGKRAHGAYPSRGINAVDLAGDIIKDLKSHRFTYRKNKYLKPPTVNTGTIRGGDKVNIVADWCEFELDFRFLPGTQANQVLKQIRCIVNKYIKKYFRHKTSYSNAVKFEIENIQKPYYINERHSLVRGLLRAMKVLRVKGIIKGSEGATVITFFQDKKIPAVATGFGSRGCAHVANEYANIDNLFKGARVLEEFLKNYTFN